MKDLEKNKESKKVNCIVLTKWNSDTLYMLRHVLYGVDENIETIKKNYYKDFAKFNDDEFFIFKSNKEANEILKNHGLKKEFIEHERESDSTKNNRPLSLQEIKKKVEGKEEFALRIENYNDDIQLYELLKSCEVVLTDRPWAGMYYPYYLMFDTYKIRKKDRIIDITKGIYGYQLGKQILKLRASSIDINVRPERFYGGNVFALKI